MNADATTIAVIGAGASGMAAVAAALGDGNGAARVVCFERNDAPGRKLLATGNGRCNLSNAACDEADEVLRFFGDLGILVREEADGRIYPCSGQAATVRNALWEYARRGGAELCFGAAVREMRPGSGGAAFEIETETGVVRAASRVVVATGGKAGPQYGCAGDGYRMARRFGHGLTSPLPALVRLTCPPEERERLARLDGTRARCRATLMAGGRVLGESRGEAQFVKDGLSGICVFDLSRFMRHVGNGEDCRVVFDFAPDREESALAALIAENRAARLFGIVPAKLAALAETESGGSPERAARVLKGMAFAVNGTRGWKEAQSTSGGIPPAETDARTGESRRCPGLFFAGEVLDRGDAFPCGGFHLHHAWLSGLRAGAAARASLAREAKRDAARV